MSKSFCIDLLSPSKLHGLQLPLLSPPSKQKASRLLFCIVKSLNERSKLALEPSLVLNAFVFGEQYRFESFCAQPDGVRFPLVDASLIMKDLFRTVRDWKLCYCIVPKFMPKNRKIGHEGWMNFSLKKTRVNNLRKSTMQNSRTTELVADLSD